MSLHKSFMPAYLKVCVYLMIAVLAGAAVAPPVFWLGQWLEASGISSWLAGFPFHRVLSRCLQISFLALLWPALRWIGLRHISALGFQKNAVGPRDAFAGLLLAAGCVALVSAAGLSVGFLAWRPDPPLSGLGRIFLTAGVVAIVEEIVFRGVVLGICLWNLPARGAVLASSFLFSLVHFLKPGKSRISPDAVQWWSGFSEIFNFVGNLPPSAVLAFGLASLLVAGWILGQCAVRTRSLWLPVGLHAGWIVGVQATNLLCKTALAGPASRLPWMGPNLVSGAVPTGLLPLAGLVLVGWLVRLYLRHVFRPAVPTAA